MKKHYKKLIHWRNYKKDTPWILSCGYQNFCVKTSFDTKDVTCPKCLELIEQFKINEVEK